MKEHLGRYPTRAELFEQCYYKEDGSPTSEAIREVVEKMKGLAAYNSTSSNDNEIASDCDDVFAKVMGKDKSGQVRMYGMGVTRNDVYGGKPTRAALERQAMEHKAEIQKLNEKLDALTAYVQGQHGEKNDPISQSTPLKCPNNQHASTSGLRPNHIKVMSYVVLKSFANLDEVVASGIVTAMDNIRVNGQIIERGFCEVVIQVPMKRDERLFFAPGEVQTIGEALGVPIAWPLSLVALDKDNSFMD